MIPFAGFLPSKVDKTEGQSTGVVNKAEALLFVPGYCVLGRSDLDTNPVHLDQVKSNQWDATKVFSPIHGHTADIVEDVVYGKERRPVEEKWVSRSSASSITASAIVASKVSARQLRIVSLEKNKYRGDPIVGFITKTVREIPVESKLPKVHCLVMEDERWDHASNGNNNTDNGEEMIDESVPYAATGPGFHVLGANPDPSLLRIERNLSETGDDRGL
ncbi:hypothetical protein MMC31_005907 [Peltigera leucophlebia]|nr:hypothetical protein [Peltigera leucophlebia]